LLVYLDTSVVVSPLWNDSHTALAEELMEKLGPAPFVSDHAGAEFAATVGRLVRLSAMTKPEASGLYSLFDAWITRGVRWVLAASADFALATAWIRRLDLNLRPPGAIHIALAHRPGARLLTFDAGMAAAAHRLGVPVAAA
jgi:predicted nucleic acid-binding protein